MLRRALIVGIDGYPHAPLASCVADAMSLQQLLAHNYDDSPNFDCRTLLVPHGEGQTLSRPKLREALVEHFSGDADIALFHFSGHGYVNELGGYIMTTDAVHYDEGIAMRDLLTMANDSRIPEVVIMLDCCHSGAIGQGDASARDHAVLREGVSVLTASGSAQVSLEENGGGIFTGLVCGALRGEAADLFGHVTIADIYAHVHPYMGAWSQRPRLRANVSRLTALRRCEPPLPLTVLRRLPAYFEHDDSVFPLRPSYEPSLEPHVEEDEAVFAELQLLARANMVEPVGHKHMYYAAMHGGGCRLTRFGRHSWLLAKKGRL